MATRIVGDYDMSPPYRVQALDHGHCFATLGAIGAYHVQISGADDCARTVEIWITPVFAVSQYARFPEPDPAVRERAEVHEIFTTMHYSEAEVWSEPKAAEI